MHIKLIVLVLLLQACAHSPAYRAGLTWGRNRDLTAVEAIMRCQERYQGRWRDEELWDCYQGVEDGGG